MPIFATTYREHFVIDASLGKNGKGTVPLGRVELERIPNPLVASGAPWLVVKGTQVGYPEYWWRSWPSDSNKTPANFQIEIEES